MSSQIPPVSPDGQSLEYQPRYSADHVANQQDRESQLTRAFGGPVPADPQYRRARDRAQYVRQQKGHSWVLHWIFLGVFTLWIVPVYYTFSPNHYWHL